MNSELRLPPIDGMETEEAKQALRSVVRERRARDAAQAKARFEDEWIETVLRFTHGRDTVACYVATEHEPPTTRLIDALEHENKTIILPKLGPGLTRAWGVFKGEEDLSQMAPGRPPEPSGEAYSNSILASLDVLVMPALALSHWGERLGQGGGWYDRALKEVGPETLVGAMVYPWEYLDARIPQDDMDMPISYALLPDGWVETGARLDDSPAPHIHIS